MQNLLKFILRCSNFLVFLLLEVVAFLLITHNNVYPRSSLLSTSNSIIAWNYQIIDGIGNYFKLKKVNEQLAQENAELRNQLVALENIQEDSIERNVPIYPEFALHYIPAKVIQMSTNRQNNYLTINKGEKDGIRPHMGVRNEDGVVGIVQTVGPRFSVVIPIINTNSNLSCRFKKNDYITTLQWNGLDSRFASLTDVAAHMVVNTGDTIVTSGLSPTFPANIPIGVVETATLKDGESYYSIQIRLCTNFRRLLYVQVIDNEHLEEIEHIEDGVD